jgi:hypothetical protein
MHFQASNKLLYLWGVVEITVIHSKVLWRVAKLMPESTVTSGPKITAVKRLLATGMAEY